MEPNNIAYQKILIQGRLRFEGGYIEESLWWKSKI